jgi:phosphoribosylaminoimidazole-succinocarboxamide synthase
VDTKYEFGKTKEGVIVLIDEIHTPDSSSLFYGYQNVKTAEKNKIIERVCSSLVNRKWFSRFGRATNSNMTDEYIETVSERYIELYENILGEKL